MQDALLDLLLLLEGLDESGLQTAGVLRLQHLLLVGAHAMLTEDGATVLLLPPARGEVSLTLGALVGFFGCRSGRGLALRLLTWNANKGK